MLRHYLCCLVIFLSLQSCAEQVEEDSQMDSVVDATFNPATNTFDVLCQDGSRESVSIVDFGQGKACLPKPVNPIEDFFAYDGTYCAQYKNGLFHCWQTDQNIYVSTKLNPPELTTRLTKVDLGRDVACGIDDASGVRCWGLNDQGLLNVPANLSRPNSALAVAVGQSFACAITSDESLQCWGDREASDLLQNHLPAASIKAKDLVVVGENLCVLQTGGTVSCHGPDTLLPKYQTSSPALGIYSNKGQVACSIHQDGSMNCFASEWDRFNEIYEKLPQGSLGNLQSIALGEDRACVLRGNSLQPFCWGGFTDAAGIFPTGLQALKKLSIGRYYCGLEESGEMKCWDPGFGFVDLLPSHTAKHLSAGQDSVCSITNQGKVTCWGQNRVTKDKYGHYSDIFSIDSSIDSNAPFEVGTQSIALGFDHSCFLQQGFLQCRGRDDFGQGSLYGPADELINLGLVAGSHFNCALREDRQVVCWGDNVFGQTRVPAELSNVMAVDAGHEHVCAADAAGKVTCWGRNHKRQTFPPEDLAPASQVGAGAEHSCALDQQGQVRCWGDNTKGQLNVPSFNQPVRELSVGAYHSCAVFNDDTFRCWGSNEFNESAKPSGLNSVASLVTGKNFTCAIRKLDSQVQCWGDDRSGVIAVPSVVGTENLFNPTTMYNTRAILNQNLILNQPFQPSPQLRAVYSFPGAIYTTSGLVPGVRNSLDYDLKLAYRTSCPVLSRSQLQAGIQVRNPATGLFETRAIDWNAANGELSFQALSGLSELSFSVGPRNHDPKKTYMLNSFWSPNDRCWVQILGVTMLPSEKSVGFIQGRAESLFDNLKHAYDQWLVTLHSDKMRLSSVAERKADLKTKFDRVNSETLRLLIAAKANPQDFGYSQWTREIIADGLFEDIGGVDLIVDENGVNKEWADVLVRRKANDIRLNTKWFIALEDHDLKEFRLLADEYILRELDEYDAILRSLQRIVVPDQSLTVSEDRLRKVLAETVTFLDQVGAIRTQLADRYQFVLDGIIELEREAANINLSAN